MSQSAIVLSDKENEPQLLNTSSIARKRKERLLISHASSTSAKKRASELRNKDIYADGEILFCRPSNKAIDPTRKETLNRHLEGPTHLQKSAEKARSDKLHFQQHYARRRWHDWKTLSLYQIISEPLLRQIFLSTLQTTKFLENFWETLEAEELSQAEINLNLIWKTCLQ